MAETALRWHATGQWDTYFGTAEDALAWPWISVFSAWDINME